VSFIHLLNLDRTGCSTFDEVMHERFQCVRVLYATATGTAEDVARDVSHRFELCAMPVACCATMDSYPFDALLAHAAAGSLFVFIIATSGDGEAPHTMSRLWTALRNAALPRTILATVRFAVFGLGDRSYPKFNAAARRFCTRMTDLGAALVVPLGLGNEADPRGYDAELGPWIDALFLRAVPHYSTLHLPSPLPPPKPRWRIDLKEGCNAGGHFGADVVASGSGKWGHHQTMTHRRTSAGTNVRVVEARVVKNILLTNTDVLEDDREVRHIELNVDPGNKWSSGVRDSEFCDYVPGDIVNVLPRNRLSAVRAFLDLTALNGDDVIDLKLDDEAALRSHNQRETSPDNMQEQRSPGDFERGALNIKTPCRLADFVSAQLDVSAVPRRRFLERLAGYAADAAQRNKLLELSSPDGAVDLVQYAYREKRTILMVLRDFPSARPPLEQIIDMIPPLRPRAFSIASSRQRHGSTVHICAALVRYTTPLRFARIGVCSSFWLGAAVGSIVPVFLERGSLSFNEDRPAVLVGPGTGIAPMRSFVTSLDGFDSADHSSHVQRVLYFGCRQAKGDYLYKDEWEDAVKSGKLSSARVAFSRDGPSKVYVQDKMAENGQEIWNMMKSECTIYIAGAAGNMPKGVRLALVKIAVSQGGFSETEAETFVKKLESSRRLQIECW
jgi:sulfite reductase alpha subunit-like flavoprotein